MSNLVTGTGTRLSTFTPSVIEASDLEIANIVLLQKNTKKEEQGLGKAGDILEEGGDTVIGGLTTPIEIVPLHALAVKFWHMYDQPDGEKKYLGSLPFHPSQAAWSRKTAVKFKDGMAYPFLVMSWYCVLHKHLETMSRPTPYRICFKKNYAQMGKKFYTQITFGESAGLAPFARTYVVGVVKNVGPKSTYFGLTVKPGTILPKHQLDICAEWAKSFNQSADNEKMRATVEDDSSPFEDVSGQH